MKYLRNIWKLLTLVKPNSSTLICLALSLINIGFGLCYSANPLYWLSAIWCAGCGLYIHLNRALDTL
jgi:hypothetical protein